MKRIVLILACFLMILVYTAIADTENDFSYYIRKDGTVCITGYSGDAEIVNIPKNIDGRVVTSIGGERFQRQRIYYKNLHPGQRDIYRWLGVYHMQKPGRNLHSE